MASPTDEATENTHSVHSIKKPTSNHDAGGHLLAPPPLWLWTLGSVPSKHVSWAPLREIARSYIILHLLFLLVCVRVCVCVLVHVHAHVWHACAQVHILQVCMATGMGRKAYTSEIT